jgi:antitoxin (DNA-binding transcriptional repressor) of toxin-antitoxin stability system
MDTRITLSEFARELADILDRVRTRGEGFLIEQDGVAVASLGPVERASRSEPTWRDLLALLKSAPVDDAFADDLEFIHAQQPPAPRDVWPS